METDTFVKYRGGILWDADLVEYYKTMQDEIIRQYKLLGKFVKLGKYVVDSELCEELKNVPKKIVGKDQNFVFCELETKIKTIRFVIRLEPAMSYSTAKLILDENTDRTDEFAKIETVVASFIDATTPNFESNVLKEFNAYYELPENIIEQIPKTIKALEKIVADQKLYDELENTQSYIFIYEMTHLLQDCEDLGEIIVKEYEAYIDKNPKLTYLERKMYLDLLLKKYDANNKLISKIAELVAIYKSFYTPIDKVKYTTVVKPVPVQSTSPQKTPPKSAPKAPTQTKPVVKSKSPAKKAGGKKSGPAPKKEDKNKKDDKKDTKKDEPEKKPGLDPFLFYYLGGTPTPAKNDIGKTPQNMPENNNAEIKVSLQNNANISPSENTTRQEVRKVSRKKINTDIYLDNSNIPTLATSKTEGYVYAILTQTLLKNKNSSDDNNPSKEMTQQ